MLLQKMRALPFLLYIVLGLTACDSFETDSEEKIIEDPDKDVVEPYIVSFFPESDATDIEVDSVIRFTFSELMNLDVLENESVLTSENVDMSAGIVLYSGKGVGTGIGIDAGDEEVVELQREDERPRQVDYSVTLGIGIDPVTQTLIDVDATTLSLKHESGRFSLNAEYTVFISEGVIDLADDPKTKNVVEGNRLGTDFELYFQTEDGEWQEEIDLAITKESETKGEPEPVDGDQLDPKVAANTEGDTLTVWRQNSNGTNGTLEIWASRYSVLDEDWVLSSEFSDESLDRGNGERIDDESLDSSAFEPEVTINKYGKAVATWYQAPVGSAIKSVWVNIYEEVQAAEGENLVNKWLGAEVVSDNQSGGDASAPEVGIDDQGNIISVWLEDVNGVKQLKTNFYNAITRAWLEEPISINSSLSGNAKQPSLTYSPSGVAVLAWSQEEDGLFHIYVSRFVNNTWDAPYKLNITELPSGIFSGASNPNVTVAPNNDAFVIWQQNDSKRENIWLSQFSGGVWSETIKMEFDNIGDAIDPYISYGADNQAIAIWNQAVRDSGTIQDSIVVTNYSQRSGWEPVTSLEEGDNITDPIVVFDFEGSANALWINDGRIQRSRYSGLTSSWSRSTPSANTSIQTQSLGVSPLRKDGRFINVWSEFKDGSFKLVSALFSD